MGKTIRINTDALNQDVVDWIKRMFPHKTVDITIQFADDTEYILSNSTYARELEARIAEYQSKNKEN